MTEYWVSQGHHWCQHCKIFIQNNAVAIKQHESGGRHKMNVQTYLNDLQKKAKEDKKESRIMDKEIKKIQLAGTRAYQEKDLGILRKNPTPVTNDQSQYQAGAYAQGGYDRAGYGSYGGDSSQYYSQYHTQYYTQQDYSNASQTDPNAYYQQYQQYQYQTSPTASDGTDTTSDATYANNTAAAEQGTEEVDTYEQSTVSEETTDTTSKSEDAGPAIGEWQVVSEWTPIKENDEEEDEGEGEGADQFRSTTSRRYSPQIIPGGDDDDSDEDSDDDDIKIRRGMKRQKEEEEEQIKKEEPTPVSIVFKKTKTDPKQRNFRRKT
jgi:hypothetical protein